MSLGRLSRPQRDSFEVTIRFIEFPGRADHSRDREPLLRNEPGIALQLCPAGQPIRPLFLRRRRPGSIDSQPGRDSAGQGQDFTFNVLSADGVVVSVQRPL